MSKIIEKETAALYMVLSKQNPSIEDLLANYINPNINDSVKKLVILRILKERNFNLDNLIFL